MTADPLALTVWQLRAVAGDALIAAVAARRPAAGGDPDAWDNRASVDPVFAAAVLAAVPSPLYLADGRLRGNDWSGGTPISALAAAERFGAAAVAEACDKGSVAVRRLA